MQRTVSGREVPELLDKEFNKAQKWRTFVVRGRTKDSVPMGTGLTPAMEVIEQVAKRKRRVVCFNPTEGVRTDDPGLREEIRRRLRSEVSSAQERIAQVKAESRGQSGGIRADLDKICPVLSDLLRSNAGVAVMVIDPDANFIYLANQLRCWLCDGGAVAQGNVLIVVVFNERQFDDHIGDCPACFHIKLAPPNHEDIRQFLALRREMDAGDFGCSEDALARAGFSSFLEVDQAIREAKASGQKFTPHAFASALSGAPRLPDPEVVLNIRALLKARIIGQDHAIDAAIPGIQVAAAGISPDRSVPAIILHVGSPGVGKSSLPKKIAEGIGTGPHALIQINLDSYQSEGDSSRITGAPPGFVGFDKPTIFDDVDGSVQVVLFEEVEKAHHSVLKSLMTVLEEGKIFASNNRTISLKRCLIFFTSNFMANEIEQIESPEGRDRAYIEAVKEGFPREFVNRLTGIIPFRRLSAADMRRVGGRMVEDVAESLAKQTGISVQISDAAKAYLLEVAESSGTAARTAAMKVDMAMRTPVAGYILKHRGEFAQKIILDLDSKGSLILREK